MWGILVLVVSAITAVIAIAKDNRAKAGEPAILGFTRVGLLLLVLVVVGFIVGFAKEISDYVSQRQRHDEVVSKLNKAESQRDAYRGQLEQLKTDLTKTISESDYGEMRVVNQPVIDSADDKIQVKSQVSSGPLIVRPGDRIEYQLEEGSLPLSLRVGDREIPMAKSDSGPGEILVSGRRSDEFRVVVLNPEMKRVRAKFFIWSVRDEKFIARLRDLLNSDGQPEHGEPSPPVERR